MQTPKSFKSSIWSEKHGKKIFISYQAFFKGTTLSLVATKAIFVLSAENQGRRYSGKNKQDVSAGVCCRCASKEKDPHPHSLYNMEHKVLWLLRKETPLV